MEFFINTVSEDVCAGSVYAFWIFQSEAVTRGVLRNIAKFTGKHLCLSLFFTKVAGLRPATLFKKSLWHKGFPVNFAKFLRTFFFTEHLWATASVQRLFLDIFIIF